MKKRRLVLGYKLVLYPNTPTSCAQEEACVALHGGVQDLMVRKCWSQDAESCLLTGNHALPSCVFRGKASEVDGFSLSLTAVSQHVEPLFCDPQEAGQTGFHIHSCISNFSQEIGN